MGGIGVGGLEEVHFVRLVFFPRNESRKSFPEEQLDRRMIAMSGAKGKNNEKRVVPCF